ncbi:MAG: hypothetical protein GTO02_20595 [Candidatus Dadabacteria bacterium]|nr:hypothetical protein [Candidatus Dadabacteria bacterium]
MWEVSVIKYDTHDVTGELLGVLLQIPNGDTQYLTTEEYKTFLKNREKLKNEG